MFYETEPEQYLRFGDVITGLPHYICKMEMKNKNVANLYLTSNSLGVVLTPCCSIGRDGLLTVAPLEHINIHWLQNEHFKEDLCIINSPMPGIKTISQEAFNHLSENMKLKYLDPKLVYTLVDYFVYSPHQLLREYIEKEISIGHYCIRFSKMFTIQFGDYFYTKGKSPIPADGVKLLELTDSVRNCLRSKMLNFFARVAE